MTVIGDGSVATAFDIDERAVHDFWSFGHVQKPRSIYRQVRSLEPGNVLLTEDGTANLTDFGISHALGDATLTATGMITATPAYLAFVQPLIDQFGYTQNGAKVGGGTVGFGQQFDDDNFFRNSGQIGYNLSFGNTVSHEVHVGGHSAMSINFPGQDALVPRGAGTVAENLRVGAEIRPAMVIGPLGEPLLELREDVVGARCLSGCTKRAAQQCDADVQARVGGQFARPARRGWPRT